MATYDEIAIVLDEIYGEEPILPLTQEYRESLSLEESLDGLNLDQQDVQKLSNLLSPQEILTHRNNIPEHFQRNYFSNWLAETLHLTHGKKQDVLLFVEDYAARTEGNNYQFTQYLFEALPALFEALPDEKVELARYLIKDYTGRGGLKYGDPIYYTGKVLPTIFKKTNNEQVIKQADAVVKGFAQDFTDHFNSYPEKYIECIQPVIESAKSVWQLQLARQMAKNSLNALDIYSMVEQTIPAVLAVLNKYQGITQHGAKIVPYMQDLLLKEPSLIHFTDSECIIGQNSLDELFSAITPDFIKPAFELIHQYNAEVLHDKEVKHNSSMGPRTNWYYRFIFDRLPEIMQNITSVEQIQKVKQLVSNYIKENKNIEKITDYYKTLPSQI